MKLNIFGSRQIADFGEAFAEIIFGIITNQGKWYHYIGQYKKDTSCDDALKISNAKNN